VKKNGLNILLPSGLYLKKTKRYEEKNYLEYAKAEEIMHFELYNKYNLICRKEQSTSVKMYQFC